MQVQLLLGDTVKVKYRNEGSIFMMDVGSPEDNVRVFLSSSMMLQLSAALESEARKLIQARAEKLNKTTNETL